LSLRFDYPDDPERPVNIIVNSQPPADRSNHAAPFALTESSRPAAGVSMPPGFRREMAVKEPNSLVGFLDYGMRIADGFDFYTQFKDIFVQQVYRFDARRPDPHVIDAGSNIGVSTLYFKHLYPRARVTAFEPDPGLFRTLQENMK